MKYLLVTCLFIFIGCGNMESQSQASGTDDDSFLGQSTYSYQAVLDVADVNGGCYGGSIVYINYNGKSYEMSDNSSQSFKNTIQTIYNGNSQYQSFQSGGCHNKYNLSFDGVIKQEMVFKNGGNYMTDVIQVEAFQIK